MSMLAKELVSMLVSMLSLPMSRKVRALAYGESL